MNFRFNLVDESWIPVLDQSGIYCEVSLAQALTKAHDWQAVTAPTALETAAIVRLLLALLHRTHDTATRAAWGRLWRQGHFDQSALEHYWQQWSHRFDLFDAHRPFYQEQTDKKKPVSTAGFFPGLAAADHFNHEIRLGEKALSPAEATRDLLVQQAFGLSGGCLPSEKLSHKASTWVAGMVFFVESDNLFQTLMCNLLPYNDASPDQNLARTPADRPNWESDDPYATREQPLGYLDYLTWPSRRVWLIPEEEKGQTVVRRYIDFVGIAPPGLLDPFKYYRKEEKSKNSTGYIPLYLNPAKAAWRNSTTILRMHQDRTRPPLSLNWLADLRREGALQNPRTRLVGYGMVVENQTKVSLMRRESIPLPLEYLEQTEDSERQSDLLARLDVALKQAEQVAGILGSAVHRMAIELCPIVGDGDPGQIKRIGRSLSAADQYWRDLEISFYQLVIDLPAAPDPLSVQMRWLETVLQAARSALGESERRAGRFPQALKASVVARGLFGGALRKHGLIPNSEKGVSSD
ncbi:MAG: type I-E CRISPR-associated protein Cse1/CasA [Anaerolineaceae bacterium]|nr:type I-E CRISPR-associated protein Cse1/CasA [Anaerolineaceae bacterium]